MKHKVFLNGVNLYDGESEPESLACWALAVRIIGVTSANAHLIRYAGEDVAREENYRGGLLKSDDMISLATGENVTVKYFLN
jgi:hypothetical protein